MKAALYSFFFILLDAKAAPPAVPALLAQIQSAQVVTEDSVAPQTVGKLLEQNHKVIFIAHDCVVCDQIMQDLKSCPESALKDLRWVSLSSPQNMQRKARFIFGTMLYALKPVELQKSLKVTPTLISQNSVQVGKISCRDLE